MAVSLYIWISAAIGAFAYGLYHFKKRISLDIRYAGQKSLLDRLRVPVEFGKDPIHFLTKTRQEKGQKYPEVFCVDLFVTKFVFLLGAEGNRAIFRASEDELSFVEGNLRFLGPFLPDCLSYTLFLPCVIIDN